MLIIIIAHLPIFTLQRQEGRIFAPMAYTVVSALIGSLLFSLTLVPLLSLFLLGKGGKRRRQPSRPRSASGCTGRSCRPRSARRGRGAARPPSACSPAASLLVPRLGTEFLPELNEGDVWINIMLPPGISVSETSRQLSRVRADAAHSFPEVVSVISKAGRPEDGTDPKMINMAEFLVDVKPQAAVAAGRHEGPA